MNHMSHLSGRPRVAAPRADTQLLTARPRRALALRLAAAVSAAFAMTQAAHALNPQPLPPRLVLGNPLSRIALNPQPLPPRVALTSDVSRVALNPQPLPPRVALTGDWSRVALNPQPLPPRQVVVGTALRRAFQR